MQAIIFYVQITEEQRAQINNQGWGWPTGEAYLNAKEKGDYTAAREMGMLRAAAAGNFFNAEDAWMRLQNMETNWSEFEGYKSGSCKIQCLTNFPRSMDVGDFIVWDDGRVEACGRFGFKETPNPLLG